MIRSTVTTIHKWLGLALAAFWLVQACSGILLTYTTDLDREARPGDMSFQPTPSDFAKAFEVVKRDQPDGTITRLMLPQANSRVIDVYFAKPDEQTQRVRISRKTGDISQAASWTSLDDQMPWLRVAYLIHYELLAGAIGHTLIGLSGIFLSLTAIAGIYLAWPRKTKWRTVLKPVAWKRSLAAYYSWHRAIGLWICLVLTMVALTGATLVWMPSIRSATGSEVVEPPLDSGKFVAASPVRLQTAATLAQSSLPNAKIYLIDPPSEALNRFRIRMRQKGETREFYGTTAVYVDASASRVLGIYEATKATTSQKILDAVYSVHTGEILGRTGRFIISLNGLGLIALGILGTLLWYRKNASKRKKRDKSRERTASPRDDHLTGDR